VGRTCQVWNSFQTTGDFEAGKPWLLRFFDQLRFYEVSEKELQEFRADFPHGCAQLRIEPTVFSMLGYRDFLARNAPDIALWKARQQAAFDAERARWAATVLETQDFIEPAPMEEPLVSPGQVAINSPVSGSVWRVAVTAGTRVRSGEALLVIESMKTEISVAAPQDGVIVEIFASEGRPVRIAQRLLLMRVEAAANMEPSP
jgi:urea carboxylase